MKLLKCVQKLFQAAKRRWDRCHILVRRLSFGGEQKKDSGRSGNSGGPNGFDAAQSSGESEE